MADIGIKSSKQGINVIGAIGQNLSFLSSLRMPKIKNAFGFQPQPAQAFDHALGYHPFELGYGGTTFYARFSPSVNNWSLTSVGSTTGFRYYFVFYETANV